MLNLDYMMGFVMGMDWLIILLGAVAIYRGAWPVSHATRPLTRTRRLICIWLILAFISVTYSCIIRLAGKHEQLFVYGIPLALLVLGFIPLVSVAIRKGTMPATYWVSIALPILVLSTLLVMRLHELANTVLFFVFFIIVFMDLVEYGLSYRFDRLLKKDYSNIEHKQTTWFRNITLPLLLLPLLRSISYCWPACDVFVSFVYYLLSGLLVLHLISETLQFEEVQMEEDKPDLCFSLCSSSSATKTPHEFASEPVWVAKMDALMEQEHIYRNPDLDSMALAAACGTNRTYLSRYLNIVRHLTFYDYVNNYRLREAEQLLIQTDMSLEAVAISCGFGTRYALARIFRLKHQMTPTQYRHQGMTI